MITRRATDIKGRNFIFVILQPRASIVVHDDGFVVRCSSLETSIILSYARSRLGKSMALGNVL